MKPLTLIYDGECGFCGKWIDWLRKEDVLQRIELLSYQSEECRSRYPKIDAMSCIEGGKLITLKGDVYSGAEAVPIIFKEIPRWRWVAYLTRIPGVMFIARLVYRRIARNRISLSCALGLHKG
jgi:lipase maturation factor 1